MDGFDAIIVGGSFAGLSVASQLSKWKVLIIDEKPIGKEIKSTCGTYLKLVQELGLEETVMQVHKKFVVHTEKRTFEYNLEENPFCVIDEENFNRKLFERTKAKFLQARYISNQDNVVKTDKGEFKGKILVDASGPRAVLTYKIDVHDNRNLFFGIETITPYKEEGLHYYFLPKIFRSGVFWIFPQGETSRIGIGSYKAELHIEQKLEEFLSKFNVKKENLHGGFGTHKLRRGVFNNIFIVGDAAGQCIPLTAEGIRPAIIFGQKCGTIINDVLSEKINLPEGLKDYDDFLSSKRGLYKISKLLQEFYLKCPISLLHMLILFTTRKKVTELILKIYLGFLEDKDAQVISSSYPLEKAEVLAEKA